MAALVWVLFIDHRSKDLEIINSKVELPFAIDPPPIPPGRSFVCPYCGVGSESLKGAWTCCEKMAEKLWERNKGGS